MGTHVPPTLCYAFSHSLPPPQKASIYFELDYELFFKGNTLATSRNGRVTHPDPSEEERGKIYFYYWFVAFPLKAKSNAQGTQRNMPTPNTVFPLPCHRPYLVPWESFIISQPSHISTIENNP